MSFTTQNTLMKGVFGVLPSFSCLHDILYSRFIQWRETEYLLNVNDFWRKDCVYLVSSFKRRNAYWKVISTFMRCIRPNRIFSDFSFCSKRDAGFYCIWSPEMDSVGRAGCSVSGRILHSCDYSVCKTAL